MIADLVITVRLTGWFAAIIAMWSTVAYIVREIRAAKAEKLHLANMQRMNTEHLALMKELYDDYRGESE